MSTYQFLLDSTVDVSTHNFESFELAGTTSAGWGEPNDDAAGPEDDDTGGDHDDGGDSDYSDWDSTPMDEQEGDLGDPDDSDD